MAVEIEWKFLVLRCPRPPRAGGAAIVQGYLDADARPTVRVRLTTRDGVTRANLNLKHRLDPANRDGAPQTALEFEYPLPEHDARELLGIARATVSKTRHLLPGGIELDVFDGALAGLVVAEIEVERAGERPEPPAGFVWRDVSSDVRFSNRALAEHGRPAGAESVVYLD